MAANTRESARVTSRYALIAGASSGFGKAMATQFARAGYNLILASERDMELTVVQVELQHAFPGITIESFSADLGVPGSAARLHEAVSRRRSPLDAFVSESWTGEGEITGARSLISQIRAIRVNVEAMTVLTHRIASEMVARGSGRILTAAIIPNALHASDINGATSAFAERYSLDLAKQVEGTGVTVTHLRALAGDYDNTAELAFDGMLRGDRIVALDGVHRTPALPHAIVTYKPGTRITA